MMPNRLKTPMEEDGNNPISSNYSGNNFPYQFHPPSSMRQQMQSPRNFQFADSNQFNAAASASVANTYAAAAAAANNSLMEEMMMRQGAGVGDGVLPSHQPHQQVGLTLPAVHVYASLSLTDVHSRSIANDAINVNPNNIRSGDAVMFSALARPFMTWAQLTRQMIEADLANDSSKWLLPLSMRDMPASNQTFGNKGNVHGRFLRYGDGHATYLCPMENDRYNHLYPSTYRPMLPLPSVNFEASLFVHLCAPSGPLYHHPPHPEDLVLETLNCYPEYKDMPIVEWRLRLMPLRDASELAPVLAVHLAMEGGEDDNVRDTKGLEKAAAMDANERKKMEANNKVHVLLYTIDDRRPGLIGSYCTIPWRTFFRSFAPFASPTGAEEASNAMAIAQLPNHGFRVNDHVSDFENAVNGTNAPGDGASQSSSKKRKFVLPTKNSRNSNDGDKGKSTTTNTAKKHEGTAKEKKKKKKKKKPPNDGAMEDVEAGGSDVEDIAGNENEMMDDENDIKAVISKHKLGEHKKVKKDPNAPKRNVGAYSWFMKVNRKLIQEAHPEKDAKEITKMVARQFKELEPTAQSKYLRLAESDKERYQKEKETYTGKFFVDSEGAGGSEAGAIAKGKDGSTPGEKEGDVAKAKEEDGKAKKAKTPKKKVKKQPKKAVVEKKEAKAGIEKKYIKAGVEKKDVKDVIKDISDDGSNEGAKEAKEKSNEEEKNNEVEDTDKGDEEAESGGKGKEETEDDDKQQDTDVEEPVGEKIEKKVTSPTAKEDEKTTENQDEEMDNDAPDSLKEANSSEQYRSVASTSTTRKSPRARKSKVKAEFFNTHVHHVLFRK